MKKLILGILIVGGLAIGGYSLYINLKSKGLNQTAHLGSSKTDKDEEGIIRSSIKSLLAKNKPMKCTIEVDAKDEGKEGKMTGVAYMANNKMRNDINIESEDEAGAFQMHTISDGEWIYSWSDIDEMSAIKMKISQLEDEFGQDDLTQGFKDLEKEYDYHCSMWFPVDKSKFIPPSNIEFKDMTEMMKGFQETMQDIDTEEIEESGEEAGLDLCKMCEMAPTQEARDKCKADAGCK